MLLIKGFGRNTGKRSTTEFQEFMWNRYCNQKQRNISKCTVRATRFILLGKTEWSELLNLSPPNKLVYNYFRKLHSAFKTNAQTNRKYDSAFLEILL
jgi:hypothetical protein